MNGLVTNILCALSEPARWRFWLTIGSGGLIAVGLIAVGLIARYGFGMTDLRWALMVAAALLAGSDIALRAWLALKVRHSAQPLARVDRIGVPFPDAAEAPLHNQGTGPGSVGGGSPRGGDGWPPQLLPRGSSAGST
jgi:hypothetical protein